MKFKELLLLGRKTVTNLAAAAAARSLQSWPTLCNAMDSSPLGSSVPGILQARTLEWVAISFSNARKWKVKVKSFSRARLLVTPWTVAHQAPLSMGFSRQEYWSGLPLPFLDKPRQNIKKQRYHYGDKCLWSHSYGFSSSRVQTGEMVHKESWALKNWYFWISVGEDSQESLTQQGDPTSPF